MVTMTALLFLAILGVAFVGFFAIGYGIGVERMLSKVVIRVIVVDAEDDDPDDGEEIPDEVERPVLRVVGSDRV